MSGFVEKLLFFRGDFAIPGHRAVFLKELNGEPGRFDRFVESRDIGKWESLKNIDCFRKTEGGAGGGRTGVGAWGPGQNLLTEILGFSRRVQEANWIKAR